MRAKQTFSRSDVTHISQSFVHTLMQSESQLEAQRYKHNYEL